MQFHMLSCCVNLCFKWCHPGSLICQLARILHPWFFILGSPLFAVSIMQDFWVATSTTGKLSNPLQLYIPNWNHFLQALLSLKIPIGLKLWVISDPWEESMWKQLNTHRWGWADLAMGQMDGLRGYLSVHMRDTEHAPAHHRLKIIHLLSQQDNNEVWKRP